MFKVTYYEVSSTVLITLHISPWESVKLREGAATITTTMDVDTQTQIVSCLPKVTCPGGHALKYYSYLPICPSGLSFKNRNSL